MKFLYSDSQDYVDPGYDFINDRNTPGRKRYWDDRYAHELMDSPPYDGLLVSMSGVKQPGVTKYTLAEQQRFLREGARQFLRFGGPRFAETMLMGDCGAFAYVHQEKPPYTPEDVVDFYIDGGFTHGCAPDHIIFGFDMTNPSRSSISEGVAFRYDLTLENAHRFLEIARKEGVPFEPIGPIQGWSPESMAQAAVELEKMGYRYLAVGGLVPLKPDAVHVCLSAIRERIRPETALHLLGFAKAEHIHEFVKYHIASFDSTSPLLRAFKDARANYYLENADGWLEYHSAIRIPQAIENFRLLQASKRGLFQSEDVYAQESAALQALRGYDKGINSFEEALETISDYQRFLVCAGDECDDHKNRLLGQTRRRIAETLHARPWQRCSCAVCRDIGVEVIIFRSSNRNKRRGFHNLGVFYSHVRKISKGAA